LSVPRAAVSAEVYGMFNKKEDFQARIIPKSEDQIQRIKARILQSFLFHNLESKDLDIVIDAMEEKKVE
jgi:cAMP-dependent protein kinase regulator